MCVVQGREYAWQRVCKLELRMFDTVLLRVCRAWDVQVLPERVPSGEVGMQSTQTMGEGEMRVPRAQMSVCRLWFRKM